MVSQAFARELVIVSSFGCIVSFLRWYLNEGIVVERRDGSSVMQWVRCGAY